MKKFKYAIGIAAMALFGACSSDAPEIVNNQDQEESEGMYLTVRLANSTRADENNVENYDNDNVINKLQIVFFSGTTEIASISTDDNADSKVEGLVGIFNVPLTTFNNLKNQSSSLKMLVLANYEDNFALDEILYGQVDSSNGPIFKGSKGFPMSCDKIIDKLDPCPPDDTTNGKAGTKNNMWTIKSNVTLTRLATRFDYVTTKTKDEYTPDKLEGLHMKVVGLAPETFASNTYIVPQFSSNGKSYKDDAANDDFDKSHVKQFTKDDTKKYRVTDIAVRQGGRRNYRSLSWDIKPGSENEFYCYERPNTLSTDVTADLMKSVDYTYKRVPYAAVKVEFWVENSPSMAAGDKVFAYNGYYLGGVKDIQELTKDGDEFKLSTTDSDNEDVKQIEGFINDLIKNGWSVKGGKFTTDADALADNERRIKELGCEEYVAESGKYYTYYANLITHQKPAEGEELALQDMYGVSRNTVYTISIESFAKLGANGYKLVGDGPDISKGENLNLKMTVKVNPWTPNLNNQNWKF